MQRLQRVPVFRLPFLMVEAVMVIGGGIAAGDPLVSAVIGGIFLLTGAIINSLTLYLIRREERKEREHEHRTRARHRHHPDKR